MEHSLPTSRQTQSDAAASSDEEIDYSVKPEFYDPKLDERDEAWVGKQRRGNRRSDAVLSCPACFTTVSVQSQRHEKYVTQYRAVVVMNCNVGGEEEEGKLTSSGEGGTTEPVWCSVCDTQVGVMDEDEVYHFFNVIPSE